MDGMSGMSGMDGLMGSGGMDAGMSELYEPQARHFSLIYWYLICAAVGVGLVFNLIAKFNGWSRYASRLLADSENFD